MCGRLVPLTLVFHPRQADKNLEDPVLFSSVFKSGSVSKRCTLDCPPLSLSLFLTRARAHTRTHAHKRDRNSRMEHRAEESGGKKGNSAYDVCRAHNAPVYAFPLFFLFPRLDSLRATSILFLFSALRKNSHSVRLIYLLIVPGWPLRESHNVNSAWSGIV